MATPEQTLCRLLLDPTPFVDDAIPWPAVAKIANQWYVGSFLLARLDSYGGQVPADARTLLIDHHRPNFTRSALLAAHGARLCHELEEQGIPIIAFKGLGVMAQLYAGPQERYTRDIDLLVEEKNLARALALSLPRASPPTTRATSHVTENSCANSTASPATIQ